MIFRPGRFAWAISCIACVLVARVSRAAFLAPLPPAQIGAVKFGYGDLLPYERWGPVRVQVIANAEAFTGRLEVRYRQDSLQSQIISVPASAAAGTGVPVEVIVNLPHRVDDFLVTLLDSRGRVVDRAKFGQPGNLSPSVITFNLDQSDGVIGCLGRVSALGALKARWFGVTPDFYSYSFMAVVPRKPAELEILGRKRMARLRAVQLDPVELSSSWAAYDALEALVIRTEEVSSKVNQDARNAVLQWVQGGGRLVLEVDQAGENWSQWLPAEIAGQIKIGDSTRLPSPPEVALAFAAPVVVDTLAPNYVKPVQYGQSPGVPPKQPDYIDFVDLTSKESAELRTKLIAAIDVPGRAIELTEPLRQRGWTTAWNADHRSLVAQGPVGFGFVTIIGSDPALAAEVPNYEASYRLWLSVLQAPLEDWVACSDLGISTRNMYGGTIQSSGANEFQRQAISVALNKVAEAPASTFSPFIVVGGMAGCTLLLAVFIGPFDAVVLKRKSARQFSWMTAIGWIGVMAIVALYAPRIVRGDLKSIVIREQVVDQMPDSPVWTSSATGFFAGDAGVHSLEFDVPTVFLRGGSINDGYSRTNEIFAPIRCEQGYLDSQGTRIASTIPRQVEQQQWTFRSMLEDGMSTEHNRLHATLTRGTLDCSVVIKFPSGAAIARTVRSATLRVGATDLACTQSQSNDGIVLTFPPIPTVLSAQTDWTAYWGQVTRQVGLTQSNAWSDHLPGAQRRRLSIERHLRTGNFALLTLSLTSQSSDVRTADIDAQYLTGTTYRILIPLEENHSISSRKGAAP